MTASNLVAAPLAATVYFARPASPDAGPAALRLTADDMLTTEGNRWSGEGEPTIYLASDLGVALAEFGRHNRASEPPSACVWSVHVELEAVVDVRNDVGSGATLGLDGDPAWCLDRERCRDIARALRADGAYDALVVPSVAMLDQRDRFNVVVFADRLRRPMAEAVRTQDPVAGIGAVRT